MKIFFFASFVVILVSILFYSFIITITQDEKIPVKGYKMAWQDEFNGKNLDLTKWNYLLGRRRDAFNVREAAYLDGNGCLHIQVKKKGDSILASMISTERLFETRYGYFECRAKLTKALGIWPAFWLLSGKSAADFGTPEKNGVEVDIFEYFANISRDSVVHNLHWGGYGVTHKEFGFIYASLKKTADNFHTFALEWTDTSYTAFVDGKETARGNTLISKVPQFMILSVECSKEAAGPLEINALPDEFIIDYVRVYKKVSDK